MLSDFRAQLGKRGSIKATDPQYKSRTKLIINPLKREIDLVVSDYLCIAPRSIVTGDLIKDALSAPPENAPNVPNALDAIPKSLFLLNSHTHVAIISWELNMMRLPLSEERH